MGNLSVIEGHRPPVAVGDPVVMPAERDQIGEIGGPTLVPVDHVMVVAPVDGGVAAGEGAPAVADGDGSTLCDGGEPLGVADIDRDPHLVHDDRPHLGVTAPDTGRGPGQRGAIGVGHFVVVHHQGDLGPRCTARAGSCADRLTDQLRHRECSKHLAGRDRQVRGQLMVSGEPLEQCVGSRLDRGANCQAIRRIQ